MSYSDKCCGICGKYQDLYDTGRRKLRKALRKVGVKGKVERLVR